MIILSFHGSPHKEGFSSSAHDIFLKPAIEAGFVVKKIYAYERMVEPCIDCGVCRQEERCVHADMDDLYRDIDQAAAVTVSSPVYFSSLPGPLKNIIDRCQLFWEREQRGGSRARTRSGMFLATAGSDYSGLFKPSVTIVRHLFNTLGCTFDENSFFLLPGVDNIEEISAEISRDLTRRGDDFLLRLREFL